MTAPARDLRRARPAHSVPLRASPARPRPARAAPRHLRVAPPPVPSRTRARRSARVSRRRRLAVTIAVFVSLVAVFGVVAFNAFLVQSQFELERIEQRLDDERAEFERLRLETARLSSPERILDIARTELGMVDPAVVTHLTAPSQGEPLPTETRAWAEVKPHLASEP